MVKLSALVSIRGEEPLLGDALRRLAFCDEIVLVADRPTQRTQEIARRHGAHLVAGIFPLDSQRRTAGAEACAGDWILEIEADEQVDSALAWEIRATLQMRPEGDWFEIPVANYVAGALVERGWGGVLGSARDARLFRRGAKRWPPRRIGGGVLSGASGGALKGALRRQVAEDVGGLVERLNRLTALAAEDRAETGHAGGYGTVHGLGHFMVSYIGRAGWREGRLGFLIALLAGLHPVLTHLRARELLDSRRLVTSPAPAPELLKVAAR